MTIEVPRRPVVRRPMASRPVVVTRRPAEAEFGPGPVRMNFVGHIGGRRRRFRVTFLDPDPIVARALDRRTPDPSVHSDVGEIRAQMEGRLPPSIEDYVPTPLLPKEARRPIDIVADDERNGARSRRTVRRLLAYQASTAWARMTGRLTPQDEAVRLRQLFEGLGGIWIKVGQLLSLRTDLLSPEASRELSRLQYRVAGFPADVARAVVERELGRPLGTVFSSFEERPFAAASISQVHRAVLRDGNRLVAVKVQRPDVGAGFEADMALLTRIVRVVRALGLGGSLNLDEGLYELRQIMREETDFLYEAANLRRMRKTLKPHRIYVPKAYEHLSTSRLLVMEYLPGVLMSEFMRVREEDPAHAYFWMEQNGISPRRVARRLVISTFRQILEDNLFHSDLHPGNIMLLRDNRVALIDFGTIGSLDPDLLAIYRQVNRAMARQDFSRAADFMICMAPNMGSANIEAARADLARTMKEWSTRAHLHGLTYAERAISSVSTETSRVLGKYGITPSWGMMRVGRALGTLDASLQALVPDANFLELYKAYFKDFARRYSGVRGVLKAAQGRVGDLMDLADDARILAGTRVRQRILAVRGMADRISRVWATALGWLRVGLALGLVVAVVAWVSDEYRDSLPDGAHDAAEEVAHAVPDLHYLHWVGIVVAVALGIRVLASLRRCLLSTRRT